MDLKGFRPTTQDLPLANGENVHLTLNMGLVYRLRKENRKIYEAVCRAMARGKDTDLVGEGMDLLYAAYFCGCMAEKSEPMEEDEFLTLLPDDPGEFFAMIDLAWSLVAPKKKKASAKHSSAEPTGERTG